MISKITTYLSQRIIGLKREPAIDVGQMVKKANYVVNTAPWL